MDTLGTNRIGVLFLCIGNSCRSQMAEGFARQAADLSVPIVSAGSVPTSPNPTMVDVMREVGIDVSAHHSKHVADVDLASIRTIITLCDEEVCPDLPSGIEHLHWPHVDPTYAKGTPPQRLAAFRVVRDEIRARVQAYFTGAEAQ